MVPGDAAAAGVVCSGLDSLLGAVQQEWPWKAMSSVGSGPRRLSAF